MPRFRLTAPDSPLAQRVALALCFRGVVPGRAEGRAARLVVSREGLPEAEVRDALAAVELIEDLHPDRPLHPADPTRRARHRQGMALALRAEDRLGAVLTAMAPQDLDLGVYWLRAALARLEVGAEDPGPFSNLDLVLAPLLWRLLLLDAAFRSHLLTGLDRLAALARRLAADRQVETVLTPALGARFLNSVQGSGALIARGEAHADWNRALGPEGREKRLLPVGQGPKPRSMRSGPTFG